MGDLDKRLSAAKPELLGEFLNSVSEDASTWSETDLRAMFDELLATPLKINLADLDSCLAEEVRAWCAGEDLAVKTLGDILRHPNPPLGLLRLIKDFAKANIHHYACPWPFEIARLIYYLTNAAAISRRSSSISKLTSAETRQGFMWAVQQPWVDENARQLLSDGLVVLRSTRE